MSNISSIIDVFRMNELLPETRSRVLIKLGRCINHEVASNITEPLICELIQILLPTTSDKEIIQYMEDAKKYSKE